jgi:hypothetical protein
LLTSIRLPHPLPTPIATPEKNESKETQKQLFRSRSDRLTVRKGNDGRNGEHEVF